MNTTHWTCEKKIESENREKITKAERDNSGDIEAS